MRVLIVGAGPTGLAAAIELARLGVVPTLIERREEPSGHSRAVGITPRSLSLLAPSGAAEAILAEAVPMERAFVYDRGRLVLEAPVGARSGPFRHVVALAQDRTERILLKKLRRRGGDLRPGLAFEGLSATGAGILARFSDGSDAAFDLVIGADGVRSDVREAAGIDYPGEELPETWSIADVEAKGWRHPRAFTLALGEAGTVAIVAPLGGGRYRVVADRPDALAALGLPLVVSTIRRTGEFRIAIRLAETFSRGRVHLAGDAAHCHSPVGGRGMNLGIADAADLARRIAGGGLDGYSAARREDARRTIALTERARRVVTARDAPRRALRATIFALAGGVPALARRLGRFAAEA